MDGWIDEWVGGWVCGWMGGRVEEWMDGYLFSCYLRYTSLKRLKRCGFLAKSPISSERDKDVM